MSARPNTGPSTAPAIHARDPGVGIGVGVGIEVALVMEGVGVGVVGPGVIVLEAMELEDVVVAASSR